MLSRLLALAIALGIAYLLLTKGWPLLQDQLGGRQIDHATSIDSKDGRCVDQADQANDRLITAARQYGQPPVDVDSWSSSMWEIESQLQSASSVCNCSSDACRSATRALDEMRELLANLDGMIRGDSPGFANPANQQERIYEHLKAAHTAVGY